jgi:hypothetical protein
MGLLSRVMQWETVDQGAIYLFERCLAVKGNYEYRIFYGPDAATQDRPWILVIREAAEDGAYDAHISNHGTPDEAKLAADQWEGPPPARG